MWSEPVIWVVVLAATAVLVVYYVVMVRTAEAMLRREAHPVLLAFTLLGFIPIPPLVVEGIVMAVLWKRLQSPRPGFGQIATERA